MARTTPLSESVVTTGLLDAMPVSESSITSRVVVNNPLLRVVLFAFDAGEMLTEHSSSRAVVVQLLDGRMDFTLGDTTSTMLPGDVIYMEPGARHALVALEPSHLSLVMVDTEAVPVSASDVGATETSTTTDAETG
jgi:quercetin dioxygenase-like cupin family protein